jgi:tetratricopeptide (TPR) repeat protein
MRRHNNPIPVKLVSAVGTCSSAEPGSFTREGFRLFSHVRARAHKAVGFFILLLLAGEGFGSGPQDDRGPVDEYEIVRLLGSGIDSERLTHLVATWGINFELTSGMLRVFKDGGANQATLDALQTAKLVKLRPLAVEAQIQNEESHKLENELRDYLKHDPDNASVHYLTGWALWMQGKLDHAITEYREALRLRPNFPGAHIEIAIVLNGKGDSAGELAEYRAAVRLDPNNADAHGFIATLLFAQNSDLDTAIVECRTTVRLAPADAYMHFLLAQMLEKKSDKGGAIAEYRESVRLEPQKAFTHYQISKLLESNGDVEGASQECERAHSLEPDEDLYSNCERIRERVAEASFKASTREDALRKLTEQIDVVTGKGRRALALITDVSSWYEINPKHPDAVAESQELRKFFTAFKEEYDKLLTIYVINEHLYEKEDRDLLNGPSDLSGQIDSKMRQLKAMGFEI